MGIIFSLCVDNDINLKIKCDARNKINSEYIKFVYGTIDIKSVDSVNQICDKHRNFIPAYVFEFMGYNNIKSNFGNIRAWSKQGIDYVNFENLNSQLNIISKEEIINKGFTNAQYENALGICKTANYITHRKFLPTVVDCSKYYNKAFIMNTYLQYNTNTSTNGPEYNSLNFTKLEIGTNKGQNNIKPSSMAKLIIPYLKNKKYKKLTLEFKPIIYDKYLTIDDLLDDDGNFCNCKHIFPNIENSFIELLENDVLYVTLPTSFYVKYIHTQNMIIVPEQKYPKLYISSLENRQKNFII
jgi:hypothetical protein